MFESSLIPSNRPVIGRDLETLRLAFGLSTHDTIWLLNLSITRWTDIVRNAPDAPVSDPSLALLVRLLAQHPELLQALLPAKPHASEVFDLMRSAAPIELKRFSPHLGAEASAGYRWMRPGAQPSAMVQRLMQCLRTVLHAQSNDMRSQELSSWRNTVEQEARARGVAQVLQTGRWRPEHVDPAALPLPEHEGSGD